MASTPHPARVMSITSANPKRHIVNYLPGDGLEWAVRLRTLLSQIRTPRHDAGHTPGFAAEKTFLFPQTFHDPWAHAPIGSCVFMRCKLIKVSYLMNHLRKDLLPWQPSKPPSGRAQPCTRVRLSPSPFLISVTKRTPAACAPPSPRFAASWAVSTTWSS